MLKVVLDTNVLLVSISERSKLHWIFDSFLKKQFTLCVTTEILAEYAEIIEQHMGFETSESVMGALVNLSNVEFITAYFRFNLLKDTDDDKFIDCAVSANANYLVSHDRDFDVLKKIEFPKIKVIDTNTFKEILEQHKIDD